MQTRFSHLLASVCLTLGLAAGTQAQNFTTLNPAQPSDTADKVEVLEFFAYTCVYCKAMEPLVARWATTLPENVVLKPVPVGFNASMADLQRLYYALEALDRLDLHRAVFRAIHDERKRIFEAKAIFDWIADQGVDREEFESVFKSFGVQTKIARANELTRAYRIEGTPTLAVGGRFTTSPSQNTSYEATITQVQTLLARILDEQTATAPSTSVSGSETDTVSEPDTAAEPDAASAQE